MKFINLTPHVINVEKETSVDGVYAGMEIIAIPPSGVVARVATTADTVEKDGFRFNRTVMGAVENLPEPAEDTIFIASMVVAQAAKRADVVSPDTGPTAQRENGQIQFVRGFSVWS